MMNMRIIQEIKQAQSLKKVYTDYRKFLDTDEHDQHPKCCCGNVAVYIAYCTMYAVVSTLCEKCMDGEKNNDRSKS
jgi:hypothetical protein